MKAIDRVKDLCKAKGITIAKLESELGFSNGSIAKGLNGGMKYENLLKIAKYFNVSMEYIATGEPMQNDVETLESLNLDSMVKTYTIELKDITSKMEEMNEMFEKIEKDRKRLEQIEKVFGIRKKENNGFISVPMKAAKRRKIDPSTT